jgi:hypothetical protein
VHGLDVPANETRDEGRCVAGHAMGAELKGVPCRAAYYIIYCTVPSPEGFMAAVLTNLYLEPGQRKFLEKQAKTNGTNLSSEARAAIDLYKAGVSLGDLELLDLATARAKADLDAINATLDGGQRRAELFFAQIASIKAGSPQ